jgi:hypothetical protein
MPLSDHERQVLADMEAALVKEDPKLVSTFSGLPKGGKGFTLAALALLGGMGVLIGGMVAKSVVIGALGFVIALAGLVIGINALPKSTESAPKRAKGKKSNWADRLNERWDNRDQ